MINVAVIGCGYWGPNMVRTFVSNTDVGRVYCCDTRPERLKAMKHFYPKVDLSKDYMQIAGNTAIDAVDICTNVTSHYDIAKKMLEHDKHVCIEKPMSLKLTEAKKLVDLAKKKKRILMVGHTFLYSPPIRKIKEILDAGHLGTLYYIDSSRVNLGLFQREINVIYDLAPHDISIFLYLLKSRPVEVTAWGSAHLINDVVDLAYLNIKFSNNITAHIHISWLSPVKLRKMTISGSEKMMVYDDIENVEKVKIFDSKASLSVPKELNGGFQIIYRVGDIYSPRIEGHEPIGIQMADFISSIKSGKEPLSNGEFGLRVVQILEAALKSFNENGRPQEIKKI